jgi:hypothetical protein
MSTACETLPFSAPVRRLIALRERVGDARAEVAVREEALEKSRIHLRNLELEIESLETAVR